ncbi:MAG: chemotaxis protein [Alteromonadaceae bacterium]|nr:MAG: chemotaxis protein [Alteromonadaceae bacterium]
MSIILTLYLSKSVRENAEASALPPAISTVQQYKTIRSYYTENVVKKVLAGSDIKPHFDHKKNANQIPLPATFIHDLSEEFSSQGMTLKLYSKYPFPNRINRRMDDFGRQAWENLNSDPSQIFSRIENVDGHEVVRVAIADTMVVEGCVNCHNSHPDTPKVGWKLGDVRGVLEVQVPISEQLAMGEALNFKIMGFLFVALMISVLIMIFGFQRLVTQRLKRVSRALDEIANGDGNLSHRLEIGANDEVGEITKGFNRFVQQLEHSLKEVGSEVGQLLFITKSLSGVADQTQEGAVLQQQESDQVATAMTEMNAAAQEVAGLTANTAENAQQAQVDAETGQSVVNANMQSIEKLSYEMTQAAQVVARLDEDSQNIGGVLDVIRGIAEQTNLLALNAAIEAARAGEQGRGFAVVADEVRTLARRTQTSTEEIQLMIEKLQGGAKEAVSTIDRGNQRLQDSLNTAANTNNAIETIVGAIKNIRNLNTQIAIAAEEQTSVSNEINRNIINIADVAVDNAQSTKKVQDSAIVIRQTIESVNYQLQRFIGDTKPLKNNNNTLCHSPSVNAEKANIESDIALNPGSIF